VSVFLLYLSFVYAAIEINLSINKVDYNEIKIVIMVICLQYHAAIFTGFYYNQLYSPTHVIDTQRTKKN